MNFGKRNLMQTAAGEAVAAASATGEPVKRVQLLPMGEINCKRDGRKFRVRDLAHAREIVAATVATASPAEIPIDYDHQLLNATQPGGPGGTAKASGWMRNFSAEADGVWAEVEWTAAAEAALRAKEYRYISPVFTHAPNGDVTRIYHAGLTNFPAITELAALASAGTGEDMDLTALAAALGLPATATLAECVAAAATARAAASAQILTLAAAAGVPTATTVEAVSAAIAEARSNGRVDPTKYAPISELVALQARLTTIESGNAVAAATAAVDAAVLAGKVTPANREWALGYATENPAGFATYIGNAPVVAAATITDPPKLRLESADSLTADELAAAAVVGISAEAALASKKEMIANGRA